MLPVYVDGRDDASCAEPPGCRGRCSCCRTAAGSATASSCSTSDSRRYLLEHIEDVPDALTRGAAWVTLWDNLLEARVDAAARSSTRRCARCRARATSRTRSACWRTSSARSGASCRRTSGRAQRRRSRAMLRAGLDARVDAEPEGRVVQRVSRYGADARRTGVARAGLAARGTVPGLPFAETDEITMARSWPCARSRRRRPFCGRSWTHAEPGPQGAVRVCDAGAVADIPECASRRSRDSDGREPAPRAVGARIAAVPESSAARAQAKRFVRPRSTCCARSSAPATSFRPDGRNPRWRASVARGGGDRSRFPGGAASYPQRLRWTILSADELFRAAR